MKRKSIESHEVRNAPKPPRVGNRPVLKMYLSWRTNNEHSAHVLLDSGCSTPVLSSKWARKYDVKFHTRKMPIAIQNFNGELYRKVAYTFPTLSHFVTRITIRISH